VKAKKYDLSASRYRQVEQDEYFYEEPKVTLKRLRHLEVRGDGISGRARGIDSLGVKSRVVHLGEVMTIDRTSASEAECRTLPYVGLDHIEKDAGHFTVDFQRQPETLLATKFRFTPRYVLYGKLRPYLTKVSLPDFDGVCTTEIFPLLPQPQKLERRYLYSALLSQPFVKWASNSVSGANLPGLDPERLRDFEIELPDLPEQRRIAGQLEQADRLCRTRRYTLELTDTFLPAAFLQLFGPRLKPGPFRAFAELVKITGGGTPARECPEFYQAESLG
jgi:type I restriction enzyme S subunit